MCEGTKKLNEEEKARLIDSDIYKKHIHDKERSLKLFLDDQNKSKENRNFLFARFDLEKVLTTPHGQSVNFTILESLPITMKAFMKAVQDPCFVIFGMKLKLKEDATKSVL